MGPNFVDEIDCGSFFDHIDDLIEFPSDNDTGLGTGNCSDFPTIWNTSDGLPDSDPIFTGSNRDKASDLSAELAVPYEDIVQLEWLSTFVEDSFSSGGLTMNKENIPVNNEKPQNQFRTPSPVSVLESSSSSSSSGGKTLPRSPTHRGPQRARSKRPRPATFNPRSAMELISETENFADSLPMKIPKPAGAEPKKKKKLKPTLPLDSVEMNENENQPLQGAVRKCMHCEITKTPQWRAGPMGPKTLCNACGVRYKSGRLFPEYRPAASPTFVPSLHSNSHKKVIEMRIKGGDKKMFAGPEEKMLEGPGKKMLVGLVPATAAEPELTPNSNGSLAYM